MVYHKIPLTKIEFRSLLLKKREQLDNRPLGKLYSGSEMQGVSRRENPSLLNVCQDSSTKETAQFTEKVEFPKRDNKIISTLSSIIHNKIVALIEKIFPSMQDLIIGIYYPLKGEPDLKCMISDDRYCTSIPKILDQHNMIFVPCNGINELEKSKIVNLYQPISDIEILPQLIIVPALGFNLKGYRIGFGGGYYDRYIANQDVSVITIGVCFHDFIIEDFEPQLHDQKVDYVVTDQITFKTF